MGSGRSQDALCKLLSLFRSQSGHDPAIRSRASSGNRTARRSSSLGKRERGLSIGRGRPAASVSMEERRAGGTAERGGGRSTAHLARTYEYSRETVGGSRQ